MKHRRLLNQPKNGFLVQIMDRLSGPSFMASGDPTSTPRSSDRSSGNPGARSSISSDDGGAPSGRSSGDSGDSPSTLAVVALIGAIGAWTLLPAVGAYPGLICGWIELGNVKKGVSGQKSKKFALAATIVSALNIVLQILAFIAFVVFWNIGGRHVMGI